VSVWGGRKARRETIDILDDLLNRTAWGAVYTVPSRDPDGMIRVYLHGHYAGHFANRHYSVPLGRTWRQARRTAQAIHHVALTQCYGLANLLDHDPQLMADEVRRACQRPREPVPG
jgi:hypothetical protein